MFEEAVTYQFIGNVTNGASDGDAITSMAAGSVALAKVDDDTVEETDVSASSAFYQVVQKLADGTYVRSPKFKPASATISGASYVAPTEQVSYFGYDGTSGDLGTITSGNTYTLSVLLKQTAPTANNTPLIKTVPWKATAATEYNVANGLASIWRKTFKREPYPMIKCELVNSATTVASSGGAFTVVKGSKTVTTVESTGAAADAAKYNSDGATLVAGDLIRFGHATTKTYPVYKVASITGGGTDAATIVLDREYEGDSEAIAANAVGCVAAASEGTYGFKFTGLNRFDTKPFNAKTDFYSKTHFQVTSNDFDADVLFSTATLATQGVGSYYEIAQREVYAGMNQGAGTWNQYYSPNQPRAEAVSTNTYDVMTVDATNDEYVPVGVGQKPVSKFKIIIATEVSLSGDAVDAALGLTV